MTTKKYTCEHPRIEFDTKDRYKVMLNFIKSCSAIECTDNATYCVSCSARVLLKLIGEQ